MTTKPQITAIAPWFGGKRTLAPRIVAELGPHASYFDLFAGSLAVLFSKAPARQETVVDLHWQVTNLARVLADESLAVELYARASRVLCADQLYYDAQSDVERRPLSADTAPDLEAALKYLIFAWQGRNGTAGTVRTNFAPSVRFTAGGGSTATRWRSAVESIPAWHERLRNAVIMTRDVFEVLPRLPDEAGLAIYADPPYLKSTRSETGGGGRYVHDFGECDAPLLGEADDHARLARELSRFRTARVVVSYYDHPRLAELYPRDCWTHIACTMQKNLHVQNRRGAGRCEAPEVLLINGPSRGPA